MKGADKSVESSPNPTAIRSYIEGGEPSNDPTEKLPELPDLIPSSLFDKGGTVRAIFSGTKKVCIVVNTFKTG